MFTSDNDSNSSRLDWTIIICVALLALIGIGAIFVAVNHDSYAGTIVKQMVTQLVWYTIGTVIIIIIMQFDSEQLWKVAPIIYWGALALLGSLLVLYSRYYFDQTGAKSWFQFGPLTFQPAEIMKPAFVVMLARVIVEHNRNYAIHTLKTDALLLGKMILWTLPICVLLKLENDFGTMLVFLAMLGGLVIVSGITWQIIVPGVLAFSAIGGTALILVITDGGRKILEALGFQSYQFDRVNDWLDPSNPENLAGSGYQLWQSIKAVGSGGFSGTGFNVSHVYVPVRESDMIFSVIGENFGFIGGVVLIGIYFTLIYRMIKVTFETKNIYYAYISTGIIMMILFHVFENIGMSIGLLPLTGIPLPFVSQGGSALIGNMIGIGLIMSMQFHNYGYMFSASRDFS
ncbi:FtsW/RodA/SpoVE family cell cycle protein [Apilactobacillus apinorum]|uniref:FtsW/RodA/SpoVE family cell cycle protein n=1 Tax=Apilactobacillus apinorum TaxID=1218495 RepID=A0ABP9ZJ89_9LACO|nr:FtsW/RodA/SpoVE family cell cycle protein [Apilactobacillus apinorum]KOY69204.1 Bacterial cell division membrane protein FtsW [Apilactobacillus apinorum]CAI2647605.1 Bacterial cell division membrane protein FtsW [Apilactobacillus apinorum]